MNHQHEDDFSLEEHNEEEEEDHAAGLASALEELGPCFIKLGQLMSTRPDLLPPNYIEALSRLQIARRALEEQLARAEAHREQPENALAALRELLKQVRELIQQQEQHKQETAAAERAQLPAKAPRQGELKDQAQDLQARAASPP